MRLVVYACYFYYYIVNLKFLLVNNHFMHKALLMLNPLNACFSNIVNICVESFEFIVRVWFDVLFQVSLVIQRERSGFSLSCQITHYLEPIQTMFPSVSIYFHESNHGMEWNKLLDFIRKSSTLSLFKTNLKTYLLKIYYD